MSLRCQIDLGTTVAEVAVRFGPNAGAAMRQAHAARLARTLDAELLAVSIETPTQRVLGPRAQAQLEKNLAVAGALGAETVVLQGEEVARPHGQ